MPLPLASFKGVRPTLFLAADYRYTVNITDLQCRSVVLVVMGSRIKLAFPGGGGLKNHRSPYPTDTSGAQAIYYF